MPVTVKYQSVAELTMDCRVVKNDKLSIEFGGGDHDPLASLFTVENGRRSEITFNRADAREIAKALLTWADETR